MKPFGPDSPACQFLAGRLKEASKVKLRASASPLTLKGGNSSKADAASATTRAGQTFRGQNNQKKARKAPRLEQWIEVRITEEGKTETTLFPSNEELIKCGQTMTPPPELVYRRINFPDGIPPEYNWTGPVDETQRQLGGCGIQRLTVDAWLEVIEAEKLRTDGHIGPSTHGNMPRPKDSGECECPACTAKQEDLDAMARLLDSPEP